MTAPLSTIWGTRDIIARPSLQARLDILRRHHPELAVRLIDGAGHWVAYEAADAFNAALLDVLRAMVSDAAAAKGRSTEVRRQAYADLVRYFAQPATSRPDVAAIRCHHTAPFALLMQQNNLCAKLELAGGCLGLRAAKGWRCVRLCVNCRGGADAVPCSCTRALSGGTSALGLIIPTRS